MIYPPERGSYRPVWVALQDLAGLDVRPKGLADALTSPGSAFPLSIVE